MGPWLRASDAFVTDASGNGLAREEGDVMLSHERLRSEFAAAVRGVEPGLATADRLCHACVDLLEVDGAAISLVRAGTTQGTFGSSNELSRRLDEYQFTFGEGPCLDSVRQAQPIHVPDLADPTEGRWPAYAGAVLDEGVHAVYALPVAINTTYVGALDLFRTDPGALAESDLTGARCRTRCAAAAGPDERRRRLGRDRGR